MIEDLVNSPPFTCFGQWLRNQEFPWDGSFGPAHSDCEEGLKQVFLAYLSSLLPAVMSPCPWLS